MSSLKARRKVSDRVMDVTAKMGVHPYHVTKEHALKASAEGKISNDDCNEVFNMLDSTDSSDADASAEEAALN